MVVTTDPLNERPLGERGSPLDPLSPQAVPGSGPPLLRVVGMLITSGKRPASVLRTGFSKVKGDKDVPTAANEGMGEALSSFDWLFA